jgi:ComF family protein
VVRELILGLKFGGRSALAHPLSRLVLFGARRALGGIDADCVVAVPLHPARLRRRGYNQAELLAEPVARALERPYIKGVVQRTRNTRPQGTGGGGSREENVRGAFGPVRRGIKSLSRGEAPATALRGAHALLVDDVLSTGATVDQCARVLTAAGASAVTVAVAAT